MAASCYARLHCSALQQLTFKESGGLLRGTIIFSLAHGLSPVLCDTKTSISFLRDAPSKANGSQTTSKSSHTHTLIDSSQGDNGTHFTTFLLACRQACIVKCLFQAPTTTYKHAQQASSLYCIWQLRFTKRPQTDRKGLKLFVYEATANVYMALKSTQTCSDCRLN